MVIPNNEVSWLEGMRLYFQPASADVRLDGIIAPIDNVSLRSLQSRPPP